MYHIYMLQHRITHLYIYVAAPYDSPIYIYHRITYLYIYITVSLAYMHTSLYHSPIHIYIFQIIFMLQHRVTHLYTHVAAPLTYIYIYILYIYVVAPCRSTDLFVAAPHHSTIYTYFTVSLTYMYTH